MRNIFFTADTHFNHANIIHYCRRPFSSIKEMNETLIAKWNAGMGKGDLVYHLGDFAWESGTKATMIPGICSGTATAVFRLSESRLTSGSMAMILLLGHGKKSKPTWPAGPTMRTSCVKSLLRFLSIAQK